MRRLENTEKFIADSELEAKDFIDEVRSEAMNKGYTIKKAGYEYKVKKSKGEIVAEVWVVTITKTFASLWGDVE